MLFIKSIKKRNLKHYTKSLCLLSVMNYIYTEHEKVILEA